MNFYDIDILSGMSGIVAVYCGFAVAYLLNMFSGVIINCQIEKTQEFSLGRFLLSLEKLVFCAIAMCALVCATNLISQGLFKIDDSLSDVVTSVISIGMFALIFAKGFIQKAVSLIENIKVMLEISDSAQIADLEKINALTLEDLRVLPELEPDAERPLG